MLTYETFPSHAPQSQSRSCPEEQPLPARDDCRRYGPAIRPVGNVALSVGDSPVKDMDRVIRVRRGVCVMGDHHDRLPRLMQCPEQIEDLGARRLVEIPGGFVDHIGVASAEDAAR